MLRHSPFRFILAIVLLPVFAIGQAPVPAKPNPKDFRLLLEPRFQAPPVWELVTGAKETGVAAGIVGKNGEPRFLRPEELKLAQIDFAAFRRDTMVHIDKLFDDTKPRRVLAKDGKTSTHCIYHAKSPLIASIVFSTKLRDRHKQEYGETLLAVAPDRYTLVIMPADPDILEGRSELLASIFDQSVYPISLEVFQIDATGIRVVGNLSGQ